ncbi:MAG: serine/threonine-protein kinase [Deltaproteobacteria bacterium]|nr:serine/threonine-protein kinase [Deltaproteobacteria bacterium]
MIGKKLVHYEITAQIGKGGMGEVYQAKDTKLGRDVAIKVLPEEFAMDHDRVARFQREAKLLASLNHPNIASIYGLEESDGTHFLVMELIEGETLKDRIKSGPIPVEEALQLALQMAEALEAAHEKGVIHRDLKPANIKVTPDGKVKVLDFGLAKAYVGDSENMRPLDSPTLSAAATQQGVILGTASYMSPEQARGKPVDKRADIWAFGVVLYEMLTGKTAFSGGDQADTLAAVIRSEPEWKSLPANLHWRVKEVLERCLEKKARDRYSGISDARVEIQKALVDPSGLFVQPSAITEPRKRVRLGLPLVATISFFCVIIAALAVWMLKPAEPRKVMRFSYELPEGQQFTGDIQLAVSPDGGQFVYLTTDGIYLRSVDALDARLVAGTDRNSTQPVFSPDGRWIAYWSSTERKLKKISISGGVPVVLYDTSMIVIGLSWSSDNTIVFSDVVGGGVKRVSADGGIPESLIKAELVNLGTEGMPVAPQMLPDGKTLLFTNAFSASNTADRQITIQSLTSGKRKVLVGGLDAMYLSTGHLVFSQVNNNMRSIVAVPLDLDSMEVTGGPVPMLEGVRGGAISDSGTLVYVSQPPDAVVTSGVTRLGESGAVGRKMVWVDFEGKEDPINMPPRMYGFPKISPDGTRVALTATANDNPDIWIWDLQRETLTRLTFDEGQDFVPIWSPDSKRIAFHSARESVLSKGAQGGGVFCKSADGTGEDELICLGPKGRVIPCCWSREGNTLLISQWGDNPMENQDIVMLSMNDDNGLKPLLNESFMEIQPQLSPDGKWLAYSSNESGQMEVYVRPFPEVNSGRWQVSTNGGDSPLWSPDGREIFYLIGNTEGVMAVEVETEPAFKPGKPRLFFKGSYVGAAPGDGVPWDIHPDGKRFFMMKEPGTTGDESVTGESATAGPRKINIVLNWDVELKQRVPKE